MKNNHMVMALLAGLLTSSALHGAAARPEYDSKEVSNYWYNLSRAIEQANLEGVKVIVPALIERPQRRNERVKPGAAPIPSNGKTAYEIALFNFERSKKDDALKGEWLSQKTSDLWAIAEYLKPKGPLAEEEQKMAGGGPGGPMVPADREAAEQRKRISNLASAIGGMFKEDFYVALALVDSLSNLVRESGYVAQPVQHQGKYVGMVILPILESAILAADAGVIEAIMNGGYIGADRLPALQQLLNEHYRWDNMRAGGPVYLDRDGNVVATRSAQDDALFNKYQRLQRIRIALQML